MITPLLVREEVEQATIDKIWWKVRKVVLLNVDLFLLEFFISIDVILPHF